MPEGPLRRSDGQLSQGILEEALTTVAGNVQALWMSGARTFLILDLPNLAITPYVRALGPTAQYAATQLTGEYNQALAATLSALTGLLPEPVHRPRRQCGLRRAVRGPEAAGLANVEDSCLTFGVVARAVCSTPNRYLFWTASTRRGPVTASWRRRR